MNGQNFWLGFAAGAIGGVVGAVVSAIMTIIPGIGLSTNLFGRIASSAAYNVLNELFQTGTLEDMDWGIFFIDLITDAVFSMLYLQWAQDVGTKIASAFGGKIFSILNKATPSLISGSIDAVVDIFQTGTWYNKRIREKIKQGKFWVPA